MLNIKLTAVSDNSERPTLRNEFIALGTALSLFWFVNELFVVAGKNDPWTNIAVFVLLVVFILKAQGPKASEFSPSYNIVLRTISLTLGVYGILSGITYPSGISTNTDMLLVSVTICSVIGFAGSVVSFWRPAFAAIPAVSVLIQKELASELFEIGITHTDYAAVVEMSLFLGLSALVFSGPFQKLPRVLSERIFAANRENASIVFLMAAIGVHFANYFYSGVAKLQLDGGMFLWLFENPTEVLSWNALLGGSLPIGHLPVVTSLSLEFAGATRPMINALTLFGQIGAVIFILRRKAMILVTLFYDLTHVVIFLVSGIFFWKWIILNLALVAAMRKLPRWVELPKVSVVAIAAILLSPFLFRIVWLGWLDTPAQVRSDLYAITHAGEEVRVPSNYFGTVSVTAAQHRLGRVSDGHFPTLTWGTAYTKDVFVAGNSGCIFNGDAIRHFKTEPEQVAKFVRLTHRYAEQHATPNSPYPYDWFPHHIWSNPWMYPEFAKLVPSDISHYVYRTVSECAKFEDGEVKATQFHSDQMLIPLDETLDVESHPKD